MSGKSKIEYLTCPNETSLGEELKSLGGDGKICVVMFTADWCNPCKNSKKLIETEYIEKYKDTVKFFYVNVDKNAELAKCFGVNSIPHFFFMSCEDGKAGIMDNFKGGNELSQRLEKVFR